MFRNVFIGIVSLFCVFSSYAEEGMATANGIDIWYETFGEKNNPALLLVMGGGTQGIIWSKEFCKKLTEEGFYVIRYDHRDAGFSTCFDFEKDPYDLIDMAKDAVGLLDYLEIEKAHLFGLSMGGPISEIMAAQFSERVHSMTVMATSCDFRPFLLALDNLPPMDGGLSGPNEDYRLWLQQFLDFPPTTEEEMLEARLTGWHLLSGFVVPFEEEKQRNIQQEFLSRVKSEQGIMNHISAQKRSIDLIQTVPYEVKVPSLVLLGSEDPIFPSDHGPALAEAIENSIYIYVEGMGHVPSGHFYGVMIDAFLRNAARAE